VNDLTAERVPVILTIAMSRSDNRASKANGLGHSRNVASRGSGGQVSNVSHSLPCWTRF